MMNETARDRLIRVLVAHQRRDTGNCLCGWGKRPEHLGFSYSAHVLDALLEHLDDLAEVAGLDHDKPGSAIAVLKMVARDNYWAGRRETAEKIAARLERTVDGWTDYSQRGQWEREVVRSCAYTARLFTVFTEETTTVDDEHADRYWSARAHERHDS